MVIPKALPYNPPTDSVGPFLPPPKAAALHVASSSSPASVAGAIAGTIRNQQYCELQAIGAGAINQTVKAIAIARGYMAPGGIDLVCVPAFIDILINGE